MLARYNKTIQGFSDVIKCQVFTDGGCWPNPGNRGGWAFIIKTPGNSDIKRSGSIVGDRVTNNIAELTAVLQGLSYLKEPTTLELITDSEYVSKGLTSWLPGWRKRDFKNVNGNLWRELDRLYNFHNTFISWVRGHTGIPGNEECDHLATLAMEEVCG